MVIIALRFVPLFVAYALLVSIILFYVLSMHIDYIFGSVFSLFIEKAHLSLTSVYLLLLGIER